jgi:predicted cupin superfamily sugar epimerase
LAPDEVIALLGLEPHPEGGSYRETWRGEAPGRGPGTAIYYLLRAGQQGLWHRIDAHEVWHWYAGAPLELRVSPGGDAVETCRLGSALASGEHPQAHVPPGAWQSARSLGDWTLCGCTVSPAFEFEHFELAPDGWEPGSA